MKKASYKVRFNEAKTVKAINAILGANGETKKLIPLCNSNRHDT